MHVILRDLAELDTKLCNLSLWFSLRSAHVAFAPLRRSPSATAVSRTGGTWYLSPERSPWPKTLHGNILQVHWEQTVWRNLHQHFFLDLRITYGLFPPPPFSDLKPFTAYFILRLNGVTVAVIADLNASFWRQSKHLRSCLNSRSQKATFMH